MNKEKKGINRKEKVLRMQALEESNERKDEGCLRKETKGSGLKEGCRKETGGRTTGRKRKRRRKRQEEGCA
jgi:hypothetical protein